MRFLILIAFLTLSFEGCSSKSTDDIEMAARTDPAATGGDPKGNQEMAARLQRAYDRFPRRVYLHCNSARARAIQRKLAGQYSKNNEVRFWHAIEILHAGQTQRALDKFSKLVAEIEKQEGGLRKETKPVYDRLAIAYLRLGEQQNCCANHNDESCLFPIKGKAVYTKRSGSESAIKIYEKILGEFSDDVQSKYLLNIAYMTLGAYPEKVPADLLLPDLDRESEVDFPPFKDIAIKTGSDVVGLSGGICLEDMNNDGRLDIICSSYGLNDQIKYLENNGNSGFSDRTSSSGLAGVVSGLNMIHADYDNDGDNDVFLLRGAWLGKYGAHPNSLLRNKGNGTFEDATIAAGVYSEHPTQNACWADFNNDGFLDLFIGNEHSSQAKSETHPCELYLNQQNGKFTEVAELAGVQSMIYAKGCAAADYDNDGVQDLYVSNLEGANLLYRNTGVDEDGIPHFEDVAAEAGVQEPNHSFPCWFFDYDNDGFQDLFVADYDPKGFKTLAGEVAKEMTGKTSPLEKPRLYRNKGDGSFEDVTIKAGLWRSLFAMGCNFGDLNNDGYLDFYIGNGSPDLRTIVPNLMFLNDEGKRFVDVTTNGRFGNLQKGHAVAFGDIDNDGDQDVYAVMGGGLEGDTYQNLLFQNPGWENNWLTLEIEGTATNRSGIGAIVEVRFADKLGGQRTVYRRVGTGGSFGSSSLCQEIGLGACLEIRSVRVNWPNGRMEWESFKGIKKDSVYRLVEGSGLANAITRPDISF